MISLLLSIALSCTGNVDSGGNGTLTCGSIVIPPPNPICTPPLIWNGTTCVDPTPVPIPPPVVGTCPPLPEPGHQEYTLVSPGETLCWAIPQTFQGARVLGGNIQWGSVGGGYTTLNTLFEGSVSVTPGDFGGYCAYGWGGGSAPTVVNFSNVLCGQQQLYLNYRVVPGAEGKCTSAPNGKCGQVMSGSLVK